MKKVFKKILSRTYRPFLKWYLRKERNYSYDGVKIKVLPGVFHPGFFFSTKILLTFLEQFDLKNKTLLELGAGSGLISIWSARRGAIVTASDISENAIKNIFVNKQLNNLSFQLFQGDLFENIPQHIFNFIIINPPYYKGKRKSEECFAWYAGEQYEYFDNLFLQMGSYMQSESNVFMILSEDCDITRIKVKATQNNFSMKIVFYQKNFLEENFVFSIRKK